MEIGRSYGKKSSPCQIIPLPIASRCPKLFIVFNQLGDHFMAISLICEDHEDFTDHLTAERATPIIKYQFRTSRIFYVMIKQSDILR